MRKFYPVLFILFIRFQQSFCTLGKAQTSLALRSLNQNVPFTNNAQNAREEGVEYPVGDFFIGLSSEYTKFFRPFQRVNTDKYQRLSFNIGVELRIHQ
jgi:hypothetical protein